MLRGRRTHVVTLKDREYLEREYRKLSWTISCHPVLIRKGGTQYTVTLLNPPLLYF